MADLEGVVRGEGAACGEGVATRPEEADLGVRRPEADAFGAALIGVAADCCCPGLCGDGLPVPA